MLGPPKEDVAIIRYNKRAGMNQRGFHGEGAEGSIHFDRAVTLKGQNTEQLLDEDNMEHMRVIKHIEFLNEFKRRANDSEWATFSCIQTCIKAKTIGAPIYIHFLAPINEASPNKEIEYGHLARSMPDDLDLLKGGTTEDDEAYSLKQCLKIAHYI